MVQKNPKIENGGPFASKIEKSNKTGNKNPGKFPAKNAKGKVGSMKIYKAVKTGNKYSD